MHLPVSKIVFEAGRMLLLAFLASSLYALDSWLGGGFAGLLFEAFCKCRGVVVDMTNYVTDVNAEFTLVHYEVFAVQMILITFFVWQLRKCRRKSEKTSLIRKKLMWLQAHADLDMMIKQRFYRGRGSKFFK